MAVWNVFRILGDLTHMLSKIVLLWSIHSNRSAEGVSLITQALYSAVFCSRYLKFFLPRYFQGANFSLWNLIFSITYIVSSLYIVFVMMRVFPRSRERERAWKFGAICFGGSLVAAPFVMMIFIKKSRWGFLEFLWTFSEILESVCVLPQLMLLRQTNIPTVLDSFYLVLLGSYRAFYILNWIVRGASAEKYFDPISVIFGVVQVLFYIDFAWVYWTRQRVKLRNGTVVDQDDMSRGYLVGKVLGRPSVDLDEEDGTAGQGRAWQGRGISISADEETVGRRPQPDRFKDTNAIPEERATLTSAQNEMDFDDDEDDSDLKLNTDETVAGHEWREDDSSK